MATFMSWLLFAAALGRFAAAQGCDYSERTNCIKAEASASVKIPFDRLFSSPPTFVLGIDNLTDQDIQAFDNREDAGEFTSTGAVQAVAWWFEYKNDTVNFDNAQEHEYTAWALESNSTNAIGGSDGGCGDLLGAECVSDLKALFSDPNTINPEGATPVAEALFKFFRSPPTRVNCPTIYFGDEPGQQQSTYSSLGETRPLTLDGLWFARKSDELLLRGGPPPSGNASFTHGTSRLRFRSLEEQKSVATIAFTLGYPTGDVGRDNVTLSMACLRVAEAAKGEGDSEGEGNGEDKDNTAPGSALEKLTILLGLGLSVLALG